jgi:hypothetical protein
MPSSTTNTSPKTTNTDRAPTVRIMARRWQAWALAGFTLAVTQAVLWVGWSRSGAWERPIGADTPRDYAIRSALWIPPIVLALVTLRRWMSLAVILLSLFGYGVYAAMLFSNTNSSSAILAWYTPLSAGPPLIVGVFIAEQVLVHVIMPLRMRRNDGDVDAPGRRDRTSHRRDDGTMSR